MMKKSNFLIAFSFLLFVTGIVFLSGCESSRVEPEITVNTPPPPPAPLILQGSVLNSKTGLGVANATVSILKLDGTTVATVNTNASGAFTYDISSLTNTAYKITATASGFGYTFVNVTVDPVNRLAGIASLPLDPIVSVAVALTPAGGTAQGTTNTESKASAPVSISVPANAVTSNTTVNVSTVPVNNVPPPPAATTTAQVGVTNLTPAGIIFAKPVTMSYPLPYRMKAGDKISVMELVNGAWTTTTLQATVDASRTVATLDLPKTGQFALLDNTKISGNVSGSVKLFDAGLTVSPLYKTEKILETKVFDIIGGAQLVQLQNTFSDLLTRNHTDPLDDPAISWILNQFKQRFGLQDFPSAFGFNSLTQITAMRNITISWSDVPAALLTAQQTNYPNEVGYWLKRYTFESVETTSTADISNTGYFSVTYSHKTVTWRLVSVHAIWRGHQQGEVDKGAW